MNVLPLYLDLATYRNYYKVIAVDKEIIELLKIKFSRAIFRENLSFRTTFSILPDGSMHGPEDTAYVLSNILFHSCGWKSGAKHGVEKVWDDKGNLIEEDHFSKGQHVGISKKWTSRGVLTYFCEYSDSGRKVMVIKYNARGWQIYYATYGPQGGKNGIVQAHYDDTASVMYAKSYINGVKWGRSINYSTSGRKSKEVHYVSGLKEGRFKRWNFDGTLAEKSYYRRGNLHGLRMRRADDGTYYCEYFRNGFPVV